MATILVTIAALILNLVSAVMNIAGYKRNKDKIALFFTISSSFIVVALLLYLVGQIGKL